MRDKDSNYFRTFAVYFQPNEFSRAKTNRGRVTEKDFVTKVGVHTSFSQFSTVIAHLCSRQTFDHFLQAFIRWQNQDSQLVIMTGKTKGGRAMNPTDAYRKEQRKRELKKNKKERKQIRDMGILKKDPEAIKAQIEKLDALSN